MTRLTLATVNAEIAKSGGKETLVKGKDYFYWIGGRADADPQIWISIYVAALNQMTLAQWLEDWKRNDDQYNKPTPDKETRKMAIRHVQTLAAPAKSGKTASANPALEAAEAELKKVQSIIQGFKARGLVPTSPWERKLKDAKAAVSAAKKKKTTATAAPAQETASPATDFAKSLKKGVRVLVNLGNTKEPSYFLGAITKNNASKGSVNVLFDDGDVAEVRAIKSKVGIVGIAIDKVRKSEVPAAQISKWLAGATPATKVPVEFIPVPTPVAEIPDAGLEQVIQAILKRSVSGALSVEKTHKMDFTKEAMPKAMRTNYLSVAKKAGVKTATFDNKSQKWVPDGLATVPVIPKAGQDIRGPKKGFIGAKDDASLKVAVNALKDAGFPSPAKGKGVTYKQLTPQLALCATILPEGILIEYGLGKVTGLLSYTEVGTATTLAELKSMIADAKEIPVKEPKKRNPANNALENFLEDAKDSKKGVKAKPYSPAEARKIIGAISGWKASSVKNKASATFTKDYPNGVTATAYVFPQYVSFEYPQGENDHISDLSKIAAYIKQIDDDQAVTPDQGKALDALAKALKGWPNKVIQRDADEDNFLLRGFEDDDLPADVEPTADAIEAHAISIFKKMKSVDNFKKSKMYHGDNTYSFSAAGTVGYVYFDEDGVGMVRATPFQE
ncbi:hypothetical protein Pori4_00010 [Pseudomonas phage vB_PpuM-Pori-4]